MATISSSLAYYYTLTNRERVGQGRAPLTKGQFMQRAFPGRYKNEQSAYQGFNQTTNKRRSGKRLVPLTQPKRTMMLRGKRVPIGSYREGLWNVVIHYESYDSSGNLLYSDAVMSFNISSSEHTDLLAVPYLQEALLPVAEEYLKEHREGTPPYSDNTKITYLEVNPINSFQRSVIDIDTIYIG